MYTQHVLHCCLLFGKEILISGTAYTKAVGIYCLNRSPEAGNLNPNKNIFQDVFPQHGEQSKQLKPQNAQDGISTNAIILGGQEL